MPEDLQRFKRRIESTEVVKDVTVMTDRGQPVPPEPGVHLAETHPDLVLHLDHLPLYPALRDATANRRIEEGCQALKEGRTDLALDAFREVVQQHPYHFPSRNSLAVTYDARAQHDLACAQYHLVIDGIGQMLSGELSWDKAETEQPVNRASLLTELATAYYNLAGSFRDQCATGAALEAARKGLEVIPSARADHRHALHVLLAACLADLNRQGEALQELQRAHDLDPALWRARLEHNRRSYVVLRGVIETVPGRMQPTRLQARL